MNNSLIKHRFNVFIRTIFELFSPKLSSSSRKVTFFSNMWRFKRNSFFVLFRSTFGVRCDEWPENVGNFEKHEIRQQTWSPEFSNPFSDAGASRGRRDAMLVKSSWTGRMSILSIESPRYPISTRCETTVDFRNFAFFSLCAWWRFRWRNIAIHR